MAFRCLGHEQLLESESRSVAPPYEPTLKLKKKKKKKRKQFLQSVINTFIAGKKET